MLKMFSDLIWDLGILKTCQAKNATLGKYLLWFFKLLEWKVFVTIMFNAQQSFNVENEFGEKPINQFSFCKFVNDSIKVFTLIQLPLLTSLSFLTKVERIEKFGCTLSISILCWKSLKFFMQFFEVLHWLENQLKEPTHNVEL
jgi:hypothetical protein